MCSAPDEPQDKPVPTFRRDIKCYRGPADEGGVPTYNLFDPMRNQYYKITWKEARILEFLRPGMTLFQLTREVNENTTLKVEAHDVQTFFMEAARNNLLDIPRHSEDIAEEHARSKPNAFLSLVSKYLFMPVPLGNPDRLLASTLPYARMLVSKPMVVLYCILSAIGLLAMLIRFSDYAYTFTYFFNLQGLIAYGLAIIFIKAIHELAHAYAAKSLGLHVPTMGIAFILMWPGLYTDVTDAWKLNRRRDRLAISFAGVGAELIIAGLSTFGWAVTEPGIWNSIFFLLSSVTIITSLLVNLNPAIRLDGYYLLSDLIGVDNLQTRAFAYTRWQMRRWLLGINVSSGEPNLSKKQKIIMIMYSICTWLYRLLLFTIIAALVYFHFTKILGGMLFAGLLFYFILQPIISETQQLKTLMPIFRMNINAALTINIVLVALLWFFLPLPHEMDFTAITAPRDSQVVYVPSDAVVKAVPVKLHDKVKKGDLLLELTFEPLEIALLGNRAEQKAIEAEIQKQRISEDRSYLPKTLEQLKGLQTVEKGIQEELAQLKVKALISGSIYEWDKSIVPRQSVSKNQIAGRLAPENDMEVIMFVPESDMKDVFIGQEVTFEDEVHGKIAKIEPTRSLELAFPQLASTYGGDLPVTQKSGGELQLVGAYYQVHVDLDEQPHIRFGNTGIAKVKGPWQSLFLEKFRFLRSLFWQESGV